MPPIAISPGPTLLRTLLLLAALLAAPLLAAPAHAGAERELACLAEAVYFEARGTGAAGETAVAHVVVNRSKNSKFPDTLCGVVGQGCQFSYRCDGRSDALADPKSRARA
ncbi:MAG TPA: cell wall hydrolase, partial [Amaricoccus sp.]|nr:cell wall hydrolase [Amaricoccus sp.]